MAEDDKLLSPKEAGPVIGYKEDTIRRLVRRGFLKAIRLPGRKHDRFMIRFSELQRFLRANETGAGA